YFMVFITFIFFFFDYLMQPFIIFLMGFKQPRCSQSDTSSLIRPLMRSKLTPLSLSAVGYPKQPQTHDVQQVNTTPLFAVGYQKPQQTHNEQPVKTTPLFAVGYLKPHQTLDAQQVKPLQLVLS
ncbi:hypothetical protein, partial [Klebsiella pneumoniae]|uniref:hypothetical protein n=1 Tax=Klebsiella pneumoniae TaxID=573 RepID=UPI001A9D7700